MAYRSKTVQSPVQGRSQAPDFAMLPGQAKDILNMIPRLPVGATRRGPLVLQKDVGITWDAAADEILYGKDADGNPWAFIVRDDQSITAHLCVSPFTTATVNVSTEAEAYLAENFEKGCLGMKSITGTTFIWNRNMVVANTADTAPARDFEAMIWCAEGVFFNNYTLTITLKDGSSGPWTATWRTPQGTDPAHVANASPEVIIDALLDGDPGGGGAYSGESGGLRSALTGAGFTIVQDGSILYLTHDTKDFTIETEDNANGQRLVGIKDEILTFAKLPARAYDGFTIKVVQDAASDRDDFWVRYEGSASDTNGTWKETIGPGAELGLDGETMPIAGTYNSGTNTWTFDVYSWGQRTIGDEELVPDPNFIGQTIQDVSFSFGRLVLVYAENVALSSAQDAGVFYPTTLAALNPADPIFLTSTLDTQVNMLFAVPFARRLMVASDGGLFEVASTDGPLTIDTAQMVPINDLTTSPDARPYVLSNKLYSLSVDEASGQRILKELRVNNLTGSEEADPLSTHDPDLILDGPLSVCTNTDEYTTLYVQKDGTGITLHCHRYAENSKRIQNALIPWSLPPTFTIRAALEHRGVFGFHVTDAAGALLFMTVNFAREDKGFGTYHNIHLDGSYMPTGLTYDSTLDQTVITLPFEIATADVAKLEAVQVGPYDEDDGQFAEGTTLNIIDSDETSLTVRGDATTVDFVVGLRHSAFWVPPRPYPTNSAGEADISSSYHIGTCKLSLDKSGHVKFEQLNKTRTEVVDVIGEFSGLMLNDYQSVFDSPVIYTGEVPEVGIYVDASEFYLKIGTEEFYPLTITQFNWYGQYNPQASPA